MIELALLILASYYTLAGVLLLSLIYEYNEYHKVSAFLITVAFVCTYLIFSPSWIYIAAYIPIGIIWSIWRWKLHCQKAVKVANEKDKPYHWLKMQVDLVANLDRVISWVIAFPISMLDRVIHDSVYILKTIITEYLGDVYKRYTNKALDGYKGDKP